MTITKLDTNGFYVYEDFCERAGFSPLDEPDINYGDITLAGLEGRIEAACLSGEFVSVRHNDVDDELHVTYGWGIVDIQHRCFVPTEVTP